MPETDRETLMRPEHAPWTDLGAAHLRIAEWRLTLQPWADGTWTAAVRQLTRSGRVQATRRAGPVSALSALMLKAQHGAPALVEALELDDVRALTERAQIITPTRRPQRLEYEYSARQQEANR